MSEFLFGLAGIGLAVVMLHYTFKISTNISQHGEFTLALLFPHGDAQRAMELAIIGFLVTATGMLVGAAGLFTGNDALDLLSRFLVATGLGGLVLFLRTMKLLTDEG